jgi:lycopene cyclase domain-containing protein
MVVFTIIPISIEIIFGYHLLIRYFSKIRGMIIIFLLAAPMADNIAIEIRAWGFNTARNLGVLFIKSPVENLIFAILIPLAISFAVVIWTFYEDNGKPIIKTSLRDVYYGTYAIWKKNSNVKN